MRQKTTQFSPFQLLYERQAILPIEVQDRKLEERELEEAIQKQVAKLIKLKEETYSKVIKNSQESQEKQQERYDKNIQSSFSIGDKVLIY